MLKLNSLALLLLLTNPVLADHSLAGFPAPLVSKAREIQKVCGSKIVSSFRRGAKICSRGRCHPSNHALRMAVDMQGNPKCIYSRLRNWPGGYTTDYHTAPGGKHVHISYNRNSYEWGRRFPHPRRRR